MSSNTTTTENEGPDRIRFWPLLTRFYGIGPDVIQHLPNIVVQVYLEEIAVLQARETLQALQAATFPHMEPEARESLHRKLKLMASVGDKQDVVDVTQAESAAGLASIGIKVVREDA